VRIKSLLAKANIDINSLKTLKIKSETEKQTMRTILELPKVLNNAFESKSLNDISDYLYRLTSSYNKFYSENHILTCEDADLKTSWLTLSKLVHDINNLLLDILAIEVPEKM
jgi:arginyl-tRNA synthetase